MIRYLAHALEAMSKRGVKPDWVADIVVLTVYPDRDALKRRKLP
jgi:hypothetical protein